MAKGKTSRRKAKKPVKVGVGRPTKLTGAFREGFAVLVERGMDEVAAAESLGVSRASLHSWNKQGLADRANGIVSPMSEFTELLERARNRAPAVLERKLSDHSDFRAWLGRLQILEKRAEREQNADLERRILEARARVLEADAAIREAIAAGKGSAGVLLLPEEVLSILDPTTREKLETALAKVGVNVAVGRDLAAGVTAEDVAKASPSVVH